jgi:hypothetical protein
MSAAPNEVECRHPGANEIEIYTPERIAEFLLANAIDAADFAAAFAEVRKLGLSADQISRICSFTCNVSQKGLSQIVLIAKGPFYDEGSTKACPDRQSGVV